jgi:16S rRNA processing protein RimM
MTIENCYKIGYIMKPHGLKGQVTISLDPDAPENIDKVENVFIEVRERLLPYFIESISLRGNKAFLKLEEVDSQEEAQRISRSAIYLPKASRPRSGRGEFYDDEVIGFEVHDTGLGSLGKVSEIIVAGPNKLLSVNYNAREVLIPLNSPFIEGVNKSRKKITVTLPEGFLEI